MTNRYAHTLYLKGNHEQMGLQHGQQVKGLRVEISKAIEARFSQIENDQPDAPFEALVKQTIQILQTTDPATTEFIRGLAAGLDISFDRLLRYNLVAFLRDALTTRPNHDNAGPHAATEGCSTWVATRSATRDGGPILAKNRDYNLEHLPLQCVVQAEPERGYRYTYLTSAGSPGVFVAGFNEAGLAVVDTHVSTSDVGPGLPAYALSMHLLEQHATVHSALAYLHSTPRLGRNNLLLADDEGDIMLFEMGHRHSTVLHPEADFLVNTNHYRGAATRPHFVDTQPQPLQGNTYRRYRHLEASLRAAHGQIDVAYAKQIMANHTDSLAGICRHPSPLSDTSTIAALIFLPAQRQMHLCHGQPCQGRYQVFGLE